MLRLAVRVARKDAELVLAELLEITPGGVEESEEGELVEYAIYGAPGEIPELPDLEAAVGGALVSVSTSEVADDWADRWRAFHQPIVVADRMFVRPPWEEPRDGLLDVMIDPGQAFGTGAHATTRLCLSLICSADEGLRGLALPNSRAAPGPAVIDVGCGSGVLAVAAAKLGFGPVLALDHEVESVRATLENAEVNGVADLIEVERFDLLRDGRIPAAPLMLANLLRPLLLCVARVGFEGAVPETMIVSGLLDHEADEIVAAFIRHGLGEKRRLSDKGWTALQLGR
jgi:ribosomal protein L11 methyltransferase